MRRQPPPPDPDDFLAPLPRLCLKIEEAATVLRLGRNAVLELIEAEKLRSVGVGRRVLVPVEAVSAFLSREGRP